MKIVNVHEAKTQLSRILQEVSEGKEIVIGRYGEPVARLIPYKSDKPQYKFGLLKGEIRIKDDAK